MESLPLEVVPSGRTMWDEENHCSLGREEIRPWRAAWSRGTKSTLWEASRKEATSFRLEQGPQPES